jgi:hypothetical protein
MRENLLCGVVYGWGYATGSGNMLAGLGHGVALFVLWTALDSIFAALKKKP